MYASRSRKWLQKADKSMAARGTKGSFSAYAERKGLTTQQAASEVLADDSAPGYLKKRANFARNAAKANS